MPVHSSHAATGAVIKAGDTAVIQYTGVIWKPDDPTNGTVFDSSWTSGSPVNVASRVTGVARPARVLATEEVRWRAHNPYDLAENLRGLELWMRTGNGQPSDTFGRQCLLARRFAERPLTGLRIMLVSAGAEEALQQGIRSSSATYLLGHTDGLAVTVDTDGSFRCRPRHTRA